MNNYDGEMIELPNNDKFKEYKKYIKEIQENMLKLCGIPKNRMEEK